MEEERTEQIWRDFADALGKPVEQLTEADKRQATLDVVLKEALTDGDTQE